MRAMTRRDIVKGAAVVAASAAVGRSTIVRAQTAPVRIGFLYPDQGVFTQIGFDMRDGFLLYMNEVGNKAGGRPLELHLETKPTNKPDEGLTKAKRLAEREKIHILGGVVSSPVAYALRGYVIEQKLPFVIMNAGADGLTQRQRSE